MKGNQWFILAMVVFLGVMFTVEYHLPKKFVWNPTFGHYDHQPFGCAVFDSVVKDFWPQDYYLNDWTFYHFANDTTSEPLAVLAVAQKLQFTDTDKDAILRLAERGNKVILASTTFSLSDTLGYNISYGWFHSNELKKYAEEINPRDTLYWLPNSTCYPARTFEFYPHLCNVYFTKYDSLSVPLVTLSIDSTRMARDSLPDCFPPVALRRPVGKGEIILISTPLLFTNYGMLDGDNAAYIFRLLSLAKDLPLYRTDAYNTKARGQESPLRYFLSQPPLRWGLYLTVVTLVLFMIFTARRKQRSIPVIRQPDNKTLEFTELIGTLYSQKKNHGDLVRKKFTYFAETVRRNILVDVEDGSNDALLCRKIASKTGLEEEKIIGLIRNLRTIIRDERNTGEQEMKDYIDGMNEILNRI